MEIIRGDYDVKHFVRKDKNKKIIKEIPEKVYFTVKKETTSAEVLIQKTLANGLKMNDDGIWDIPFNSNDTAELPYGTYVYDICIKNGDRPKTIKLGYLEIKDEVTHKKDEV